MFLSLKIVTYYIKAKLNEYFCIKNISLKTSKKIFLIGFMGSGKTTIGKKLAYKLNIPFFDIDEEVVNDEGKDIPTIFEMDGEDYFRQKEHEKLVQLINDNETFVISTGGGTPSHHNNMDVMNTSGTTFYLKYTPEFLVSRLKNALHKRPLLKNVTSTELNSFITSLLAERALYYNQSHFTIEKINLKPADFLTFFKT